LSHEALLRRWDRLRNWIRQEDKDATQFRSLADRVNRDSNVLRGRELRRTRKWVREFQPSAVWAEHYQGPWDVSLGRHQYDYAATMRYIKRSRVLGVMRGILYAAVAFGLVTLSYRVFQNDRARRAAQLAQAKATADSMVAQAAQSLELAKMLEAKNQALLSAQNAQSELARSVDQANKARYSAELARATAKVAEEGKQQADSLNKQLTAKTAALDAQNVQLENTSKELTQKTSDLEKSNNDLLKAQDDIKKDAARREADSSFSRLASEPPEYSRAGVVSRLQELSDAIAAYDAAYHHLPAGSMTALAQAVSLSYLSGSDTSGTDPVLFTIPDPSAAGGLTTVRSGALPLDWGIKVPRKFWSVQQANPLPDGRTMSIGGVGGYVAFPGAQKSPTRSHKLDPFAITALGASTDGEWIATASASGDMRVFRYRDFASAGILKDRFLQFGNAAKLVGFLMIHRYAGEYPVRQFAISVAPHSGRQSEKNDLDVVALTESGRLLRWVHPGPIGKQLSRLDDLLVDTGSATARAIATNPATQVVWAAANDSFGIVRNRQFVKIGAAPNGATISAMSWNANGSLLAVGLRNGSVCIYQTRDAGANSALDLVVKIPGHSSVLTTLAWSGSTLASGSTDGSARLWNLDSLGNERPLLNLLGTAAAGESTSTDAQGLEKQYAALAPYLKTRLDALAASNAH
jgi:WD40 repeat protein